VQTLNNRKAASSPFFLQKERPCSFRPVEDISLFLKKFQIGFKHPQLLLSVDCSLSRNAGLLLVHNALRLGEMSLR
jgi:hypothetical protein